MQLNACFSFTPPPSLLLRVSESINTTSQTGGAKMMALTHLFRAFKPKPAHLKGVPRIQNPVNSLWHQICHEHNLQQAYTWLCEESGKRDDTHHNSDVWEYRRHWAQSQRDLQQRLRGGEFQFQPVPIVEFRNAEGKLERREIPCAEDRLVIRAISQVLQSILPTHLAAHCTHIKGNGGLKQSVRETREYIAVHPNAEVIKSDIKGYYANIDHTILAEQLQHMLPGEI